MNKVFRTIEELSTIVDRQKNKLVEIKPEYLSDAGKAALEAYQKVAWTLAFYDTSLEELASDETFMNLVSVPDKHPEYYRVLRTVNRAIERAIA